jgi:N-acetylglucosamine-6-phosphate deacetylase
MSAMGLAPGNYRLGNMNVTKEEDRVYIEKTDTLAGRYVSLHITGFGQGNCLV